MGVHYHLLGRIPQLGGYHRSKDHLFRDLSSLRQDHQILRLCRSSLRQDHRVLRSCHQDLHKERERLSLPVPLNHLFNPHHLAAVLGILILSTQSVRDWHFQDILRLPTREREEWKKACLEELESL